MTVLVETDLGRFNLIANAGPLFECPCGEWLPLSEDQANGTVSVDHAAHGCPVRYHETHNYQAVLRARVAAASLCLEDPFIRDAEVFGGSHE